MAPERQAIRILAGTMALRHFQAKHHRFLRFGYLKPTRPECHQDCARLFVLSPFAVESRFVHLFERGGWWMAWVLDAPPPNRKNR